MKKATNKVSSETKMVEPEVQELIDSAELAEELKKLLLKNYSFEVAARAIKILDEQFSNFYGI